LLFDLSTAGCKILSGMKRSGAVSLTVVAAFGVAARAEHRLDPCATANFNEAACAAAVQNRGYCWNGRWVRVKYHYPYPYYFDAYQEFLANGGTVSAAVLGSCSPSGEGGALFGAHGASRAGFGSTGACHSGHA